MEQAPSVQPHLYKAGTYLADWMIRFRRIGSKEGDQKIEFSTLPTSPFRLQPAKILKKCGQGKRILFYRENTKGDLRMGLSEHIF
jgi:hypothetical protein